jgi:hypothetical protein
VQPHPNLSTERFFALRRAFTSTLQDSLRQLLQNPTLTIDVSLQAEAQLDAADPNTVFISLQKGLLVGRGPAQRLQVKLVAFEGRMFRFPRPAYSHLSANGQLAEAELALLQGPNTLAWVNKHTRQVLLQALPTPERAIHYYLY